VEQLPALIGRVLAGDLNAYGAIVQRFQGMALGYAYSILGDFQLAEDASQEAFLEAFASLAKLHHPAAFPGWFRKIVYKHCDRLTRGRRFAVISLDESNEIASLTPCPDKLTEIHEMKEKVFLALQTLPEHDRMVTALFCIDGYSQKEIGEFLELPVTTVKKRLHDARKRLKERMIEMVGETLKDSAPGPRFSRRVIEELLRRPRPLEIEAHPVNRIWEQVKAVLSEYEIIVGEEIIDDNLIDYGKQETEIGVKVYHVSDRKILRAEMTHATFQAMRGKEPPVRLLAAGRVFRQEQEDERHARVFHQVDGLCIERNAGLPLLKETCARILHAVFGKIDIRWRDNEFPIVDSGMEFDVELDGQWHEAGGCGLLRPAMLIREGFDPAAVGGFAFGLGLERLAMLRFGIEDIRRLWRPPYVP
jgi:RNA polymerase sigma factor (sigma-70 family)